jgi:hypothetical protein
MSTDTLEFIRRIAVLETIEEMEARGANASAELEAEVLAKLIKEARELVRGTES